MADVEIPKKHKACVYDAPGEISTKVEILDTPEPGAGEVLIHLCVITRFHHYTSGNFVQVLISH